MTVGKDAMEHRPSRPPRRATRRSLKSLRIFLLGLAAGVAATQVVRWLGADASGALVDTRQADLSDDLSVVSSTAALELDDAFLVFVGPEAPEISTFEGEIEPDQFMAVMLVDAGLTSGEADRTVRALDGLFDPTKSRPGDHYRVDVHPGGTLARFEYRVAPDEIYLVAPGPDGSLHGARLLVEISQEVVEVSGEIQHSLWLAFEASGESPALAANLNEVFQFDIDFFHDTRKGDRFRFFVDKFSHRGELVRYGQIYAAEYIGAPGSPVGTRRLYWYENKASKTRGFYDETGKAAQRAFLRSPLKYTRISSGFGYRRHPILGRRHFHGGIDYAAPTGTPVRSVADGTVTFAGRSGASGKMVRIRHAGGYDSFYLHLSAILVRRGSPVSQSTVIGRVGSTGRSTGPHLDFRLKRHGKYLDPRRNVAPRTKAVPDAEKASFLEAIQPWVKRLSRPPAKVASSEVAQEE